jgi:predicted ATP-grasp superfamily ATP-dependent carboligase
MKPRPTTDVMLEHGKERLATEFSEVPKDEISKAVDGAAGRLLQVARFDDYVPVLAQRYVRDSLLDRQAA